MQASVSYSHVSLLKTRSKVYKLGLIMLICSFLAFIIGFSSSGWIILKPKGFYETDQQFFYDDNFTGQNYAGLWSAPCFHYGPSCLTGLLVARIAFCFHFAGYILCLVVAVYENCKKVNPISYHSRVLELCVFVTGFVGTAGISMFVVWYAGSFYYRIFGWSMAVILISVTGIYCSLFMFLCGNRRQFVNVQGTVLQQPQPGGVIYFKPGNPDCVVLSSYEPSHSGGQAQQASQNQPLLPAHPYFYPPASHSANAPPPYSFPPAYPLAPSQPPGFSPLSYHEYQSAGNVQATAPLAYDDTKP